MNNVAKTSRIQKKRDTFKRKDNLFNFVKHFSTTTEDDRRSVERYFVTEIRQVVLFLKLIKHQDAPKSMVKTIPQKAEIPEHTP